MNALLALEVRHYDALRVQRLVVRWPWLLLLLLMLPNGHRGWSQCDTGTVLPLFLQFGYFLSPLFFFADLVNLLSYVH